MSVVKIARVRNIKRTVDYLLQNHKTNDFLYSAHECTPDTIIKDFKYVTDLYNEKNNANKDVSARMIIQSFDPNDDITPEQAHKYGVEYAKNYLNNEHQYLVVTHVDANHLHNHIIFNNINYKNLTMFNSKRSNSLYRLRYENDKISEKYGLKIIEKTRAKSKYLSFNEYVARSKGISFKERIENDIDDCILKANNFDEFLELMKDKGYEYKTGKYLSFKHPKAKKFIRTKTLGFNYLENSIKYRIENKDYVPFKYNITSREWIDKNQQKFKESKGLRRWATIQNINYLNEIYKVLEDESISFNEFLEREKQDKKLIDKIDNKLLKVDNTIYDLERMRDCFDVYRDSYKMIKQFKSLESEVSKQEFKKEHYAKFKKYDIAKKQMNILKKVYHIHDKNSLYARLESLKDERDLIYKSLNINIQQDKHHEIEKNEKRQQNQDVER